jgi:hypothetical protein
VQIYFDFNSDTITCKNFSFLEMVSYSKSKTLSFPFMTRISDLQRFCNALHHCIFSSSLNLRSLIFPYFFFKIFRVTLFSFTFFIVIIFHLQCILHSAVRYSFWWEGKPMLNFYLLWKKPTTILSFTTDISPNS